MKTAEEKAEMLRHQVVAKVRWGARDQEVVDWLRESHGITGSDADSLLSDAHRAKRKAVRGRAILTLIFSLLGIFLAVGFVGLQLWEGLFVIGYGSLVIIGIGFVRIGVFCRSLMLLFTGHTEGSVE